MKRKAVEGREIVEGIFRGVGIFFFWGCIKYSPFCVEYKTMLQEKILITVSVVIINFLGSLSTIPETIFVNGIIKYMPEELIISHNSN